MTLETLANAKLHLHITDPARDAEVTLMLEHASALIVDYLGAQADPAWTETTAPDVVQAATLKMLGHLWEHRGDDVAPDDHDEKIWKAIALLLMRTRDPALA
jgi:predicted HD phosphohydrolase